MKETSLKVICRCGSECELYKIEHQDILEGRCNECKIIFRVEYEVFGYVDDPILKELDEGLGKF
jgi:hypothetical protein